MPWGSQNKTEITAGVTGIPVNGTWSFYYNGTNVSTLYNAWKSYNSPRITIY